MAMAIPPIPPMAMAIPPIPPMAMYGNYLASVGKVGSRLIRSLSIAIGGAPVENLRPPMEKSGHWWKMTILK